MGLYSDRFQSKYGKRKPFMLVGALVLTLSFYALIHPPTEHSELWFLGFSMLVYLGWSIISIPYLAWSAEITPVYHEKTRLSAARELFTIVGALSALLIPYLYGVSEDADKSLNILYVAFVITLFILLPLTLINTKEATQMPAQQMTLNKIKTLWQKNLLSRSSSVSLHPQLSCQCTACDAFLILCRTCTARSLQNRSSFVALLFLRHHWSSVLDNTGQENRQTKKLASLYVACIYCLCICTIPGCW